jgi:3-oxoacyl-[acyl-carrier protein] reductase
MYVVTGGSDGLGLELANILVAKGKKVVSLSRSEPKGRIKRTKIDHIPCDLTNEGSINAAAQQVIAMDEPIEALINCAGLYNEQPVEDLTGPQAAAMFTVNIIGPEILTARLLKRLIKDESDIINVSSIMATRGDEYAPAYTTSKWAMRGFSQVLQTRLASTNCRVVSFCPGGMDTAIFKKGGVDLDSSAFMQPSDVANFMWQILCLPKNMEISEVIIKGK